MTPPQNKAKENRMADETPAVANPDEQAPVTDAPEVKPAKASKAKAKEHSGVEIIFQSGNVYRDNN